MQTFKTNALVSVYLCNSEFWRNLECAAWCVCMKAAHVYSYIFVVFIPRQSYWWIPNVAKLHKWRSPLMLFSSKNHIHMHLICFTTTLTIYIMMYFVEMRVSKSWFGYVTSRTVHSVSAVWQRNRYLLHGHNVSQLLTDIWIISPEGHSLAAVCQSLVSFPVLYDSSCAVKNWGLSQRSDVNPWASWEFKQRFSSAS